MIGEMFEQVIAKSAQVTCDAWHTAGHALQGCISPGFVVAWKDTQVTAAHKLAVIQTEYRVSRRDEVRMVDNLHFVLGPVVNIPPLEEMHNLILVLVNQRMSDGEWVLAAFP